MKISFEIFLERVREIRARIAAACEAAGRDPAEVNLMAVTKTHPVEAAAYAARAGLPCIGENRVQEAVKKMAEADFDISWELIGHLQSNKAKAAAEAFARIQSVDRIRLVRALDRHAGAAGKSLRVLLQINAGEDPAKFGAAVSEAPALLEAALGAKHLRVEGLMTIAPLADTPDVARATFARLRKLRDELREKFGAPLPELSMGMTGDLNEAILEGATLIRIGTALYGNR